MDPTHEPRSSSAEPTWRDLPSDDAVVAYLRANAPGLPAARFDPRAITARARRALRRRRLRASVVSVAAATSVYLALALAGPMAVPGLGSVAVPGSDALRPAVRDFFPGTVPGPDQWHEDVARLEADVLPVVEELELFYYLLEPGSLFDPGECRILEYPRGQYRDGDPKCRDLVPFDDQARMDFDAVTRAVERSGVSVERIFRSRGAIYIRLPDYSWQYNWAYVYLSDVDTPPPARFPGEEWTHIRGDWWFHRAHDD